jgi:hypothetical protein
METNSWFPQWKQDAQAGWFRVVGGVWKHKDGDFLQIFRKQGAKFGVKGAKDADWTPESEFVQIQSTKIYDETTLKAKDSDFKAHPSYNWATSKVEILTASMSMKALDKLTASPT